MKTILIPTDFSESAENALHFAILLAKQAKAKLVLVNAFQIPIPISEIPYQVLHEEQMEKKKESEIKLRSECEKIKDAGDIDFEYYALDGLVIDAILDFSKSRHFDYIIMGTNGAGKHTGLFGSTTSKLMTKTDIPLIAIPESTHFNTKIRKMAFATNYNITDVDAIAKLSSLASAFNAQINVFHISEAKEPAEEQVKMMEGFMKMVNAETNYSNLSFQLITGENTEARLEQFIENEHTADILVMSTHLRNSIERLFGTSMTKHMALKTKIPLIIFHYHKEA